MVMVWHGMAWCGYVTWHGRGIVWHERDMAWHGRGMVLHGMEG